MLTQRGDAQRLYRNALVYLAPDEARVSELRDAVAQYLAWSSIVTESDDLGLTAVSRGSQAASKKKTSHETVEQRVRETYVWLLSPRQDDPKSPEVEWTESRLQGGEALAERAAKKLVREEALFLEFAPVRLRMGPWTGTVCGAVRRPFGCSSWRRTSRGTCTSRGSGRARCWWTPSRPVCRDLAWTEHFAYASAEADGRYVGLKAGERTSVYLDSESLLVMPEAAQRRRAADADAAAKQLEHVPGEDEETPGAGTTQLDTPPEGGSPAPKARRFHGTIALDAVRMGRDAGQIAEAIVQHLAALGGATVRVTLEIHADVARRSAGPCGADGDRERPDAEVRSGRFLRMSSRKTIPTSRRTVRPSCAKWAFYVRICSWHGSR